MDVLIHMCQRISDTELNDNARISSFGHMEVACTAQDANAKTCVITHVTEQMDSVGMHEKRLREMGAVYAGNLIWGEDLMTVPLKGPQPRALK
ncbi:MAG: ribonuclease Z [Gammaproteobacteria bacterium]